MIYNKLGNTGLEVSKLCFGSLTISPLQTDIPPEEGGKLIAYAMEKGINFLDTADLYDNYSHIKYGMKFSNKDLIITTKSYDYTEKGAENSLSKALHELDRDYVDIYMLHEQESEHTIRGHWEAINYLIKQRQKGKIRAIGISTHRVEGVYAAADVPEIEVIHPIINYKGVGIEDGKREDMEKAIQYAKSKRKGIYAMKVFGGGNLAKDVTKCFDYVLQLETIDSMAIGMQTKDEVDYNIKRVLGEDIQESLADKVKRREKELLVEFWCTGCGTCEKICHQDAIHVVNGKAIVNKEKCLVCGYCGAHCPQFCIKVV